MCYFYEIFTVIMGKNIESILDKCLCKILIPQAMFTQAMTKEYQCPNKGK